MLPQQAPRVASVPEIAHALPVATGNDGLASHGNLLAPGALLGGKLEIRALLGEGGMGQVFEAYDRELHRRVAVKVAWPHAADSVRKEALALATLRHPSIITIHELGHHDGRDYVVMERINGISLEEHLQGSRSQGMRLPIGEILDTLLGVADGVAVVHGAGMAHRDIKPANVMLAPDNRVVLTDFGAFRPEGPRREGNLLVGSPAYMAPETITGAVSLGEEYLVDVYALGVVTCELLTGELPFAHDSVCGLFALHLTEPPPDPRTLRPETPPALATLALSMLAKDPEARPQSMREIAWQLRRLRAESLSREGRIEVVIVEDNAASAAILESLVLSAAPDATIRIARDGLQALECVRSRLPDLLVLDLRLPGMTGVEVCARIRDMGVADRCAIVCTSSHPDAADVSRLRRLGFPRFMGKGDALVQRLPPLIQTLRARARVAGV